MRKRVLSFLLAASAAFCFMFSSAPEAQAIVPIGFVQSALASYVSSTGYKLYNDNGTGQDILGSLGELYDDYVTVSNKTITGQLANLAFLANSPYIYQDNSGQIVISKVAADIFQDFADWIQTEYSVPVGSDTPTSVVTPVSGGWSNGAGVEAAVYTCTVGPVTASDQSYYLSPPIGRYNSNPLFLACTEYGAAFFLTREGDHRLLGASDVAVSGTLSTIFLSGTTYYVRSSGLTRHQGSIGNLAYSTYDFYTVPESTSDPRGVSLSSLNEIPGVAGLGVTLAQAVADVVGQAKEDDAVVIGVGASAGATAQDIADMVAQGVKAQTLNPSVSITAEAVIDTPVQPYPDIDGLGLPTLGAALVDRFPFCIPWDFVDTVKLLSADPQPINIKVDLIPQRIKTSVGITSDTSFDIDFSGEQYAKIGVFCRWGSLITFCFGLFLLTKRLVWTA